MNSRCGLIGGVIILTGAFLPASAGEKEHPVKKTETVTHLETSGYAPVRQLTGELTLDEAIRIALRQNPAIIAAIQEIERTRGELIQVRASALPQITLSGNYSQVDRYLLRGGGANGGATVASPLAGTSVGTPSAFPAVTSAGATSQTQGITPIQPITTSGTGTGGAGGALGTTTTAAGSPGGTPLAGLRGATATAAAVEAEHVTRQATTSGSGSGTAAANTGATAGSQTSSTQILQGLGTQGGNNSGGSSVIQDKSWNITIEARQLLYAGGQVRAALKIAAFSQDSAYYSLRDTIDTIVSTVRTQFYTVLLDRALIVVQEESVRLLEQQLQDQRNRFEAGTVPRFNVLQAGVALANQRPALISARNNYLLSQAQLAKTLGIDPGPGGKPAFYCVGELGVPPRHIDLSDALLLSHARRPFLKVQRLSILIDAEDIKVELAGYKPLLSANAAYEFRNKATSDDISDTVNGWFFGVTGSWNIFDGFATYGRVKQARARLEESKINYDDSVHQVDLQVQTAYSNLLQARETIVSQQENVAEALEAVRLAQERLNAGAGTQLDVLNAQVQLTQARTTELQARTDYNISLAQLDLATGTETVYEEPFKDPLAKVEKGIFARLAETGLPKLPPPGDRGHGKD